MYRLKIFSKVLSIIHSIARSIIQSLIALSTLLALSAPAYAKDLGTAHHDKPKEPIYLKAEIYADLKSKLKPPPLAGSIDQKNDEETLFKLQNSRTAKDCQMALSEVQINLAIFYGGENKILDDKQIEKLDSFFAQLKNDSAFFILKLKEDLPRQRPYLYLTKLTPCTKKEVSQAYPSGHAALSKLFSDILSDLYPNKKAALEKRGLEIANHRVLAGVHHPTDIQAGRALADELYLELKKTSRFNEDYKKLKLAIATHH